MMRLRLLFAKVLEVLRSAVIVGGGRRIVASSGGRLLNSGLFNLLLSVDEKWTKDDGPLVANDVAMIRLLVGLS